MTTPTNTVHLKPPIVEETSHSKASGMCNWISVMGTFMANILSNYDLQTAEDKSMKQIGEQLDNLGFNMNSALKTAQGKIADDVAHNKDHLPISQGDYSRIQLDYQNQMQGTQRHFDQQTQVAKDVNAAPMQAIQTCQTLTTIAQNLNNLR